jgi:hypothetical protein
VSEWYYAVDGVQQGPVTADDLRRFLIEKRLTHDDYVWTPTLPEWTELKNVRELVGAPPLFTVGVAKLLVMILVTFGLYELYWMYKQWEHLHEELNEDLSPFWRTVFSVFFFHRLVGGVNVVGERHGIHDHLPVSGLTALFVLTSLCSRLPDPWWLIALVSVVPIMVVQRRVNAIHAVAAPLADRNTHIRRWNWLAIILGLLFLALVVIGLTVEA